MGIVGRNPAQESGSIGVYVSVPQAAPGPWSERRPGLSPRHLTVPAAFQRPATQQPFIRVSLDELSLSLSLSLFLSVSLSFERWCWTFTVPFLT